MKTKKCIGCGATLQYEDPNKEGYIEGNLFETSLICKRCFRLKNYNEYQITSKNNDDYLKIIDNISNTGDLVLYIVDIFNLNNDDAILKRLKNDVILVLTKKDIIPKSVKDYKVLDYFDDDKYKDLGIISSLKNYNLDKLYKKIMEYKKSNNVYIIGKTNAGKSTLINKMIKNYSKMEYDITTSCLPSTTLDTIKVKLNDEITLIDTPGIIDETDIINYLDIKAIKKITPKKEIKPMTFQFHGDSSIVVDNYCRIDTSTNNITVYASNELVVRKNSFKNEHLKDLKHYHLSVKADSDIVVNGLLWIKVAKDGEFDIYTYDKVSVYTRKSII